MSEKERKEFFSKMQKEFDKEISNCKTPREKAVVAAKFLATRFPKLPYFWGGGHELSKNDMIGIGNKFGSYQEIIYGGGDNYPVGESFIYSYDCSGFVSWCLINSGFSGINSPLGDRDLAALGKEEVSITSENIENRVKPGDLATQNGHIGIVINVDKKNHEVSIAHISEGGGGMNITTQSTKTGLITKDDIGNTKDLNKNGETKETRIGKPYFTDIVLMDY